MWLMKSSIVKVFWSAGVRETKCEGPKVCENVGVTLFFKAAVSIRSFREGLWDWAVMKARAAVLSAVYLVRLR